MRNQHLTIAPSQEYDEGGMMHATLARFCSVANSCPLADNCKIAESCEQLEDFAAELISESIIQREGVARCQELMAFKRRAAFKLISSTTPKEHQGLPAIPMGSENAFFSALEKYQKDTDKGKAQVG